MGLLNRLDKAPVKPLQLQSWLSLWKVPSSDAEEKPCVRGPGLNEQMEKGFPEDRACSPLVLRTRGSLDTKCGKKDDVLAVLLGEWGTEPGKASEKESKWLHFQSPRLTLLECLTSSMFGSSRGELFWGPRRAKESQRPFCLHLGQCDKAPGCPWG